MSLYHPVKIGSLELSGNLFLAPVAGWTDRAYRSICLGLGADFCFTELVSSEAICRNNAKTEPLIRRGKNETSYAVQLFGADPEVMRKAASFLEPYHPDVIDLNAGCPVPKVTKTGAGSALMKNPILLGKIVHALVSVSNERLNGAPVTVKMRSGWDNGSINYTECARAAIDEGAAMISLHPRTRAQVYSGKSNWDYICDLASRVDIPVTGSGDLFTATDAKRMLSETGCAAVMFARGAMGNPFIFRETRSLLLGGCEELKDTNTFAKEKIEIGFRHLDLLASDLGEKSACLEMRKIFCAYTKGIHGGAALRDRLVHAETIEDYKHILFTGL
ncbi:tRNA-dihydrouridine synthase [Spirochaetia bacterium]|nr:tRNA-dihydrouridine synthase [Spirochaetia bacterium]